MTRPNSKYVNSKSNVRHPCRGDVTRILNMSYNNLYPSRKNCCMFICSIVASSITGIEWWCSNIQTSIIILMSLCRPPYQRRHNVIMRGDPTCFATGTIIQIGVRQNLSYDSSNTTVTNAIYKSI